MTQSLAEVYAEGAVVEDKMLLNPTPLDVVKNVYDACDDAKGKEVVILDVAKNFGLADYFIIASGRSDRHSQGIANKIIDSLDKLGIEPYSIQGMENGQWVVIDCSEVVVHIFYEPLRDKYDLESLWMNAKSVERTALRESPKIRERVRASA